MAFFYRHIWAAVLAGAAALSLLVVGCIMATELHVDPNAAADQAGNEANATTGWDVIGGGAIASYPKNVLDAGAGVTGDYFLSITAGIPGEGKTVYKNIGDDYTLEVGATYLLTLDGFTPTGVQQVSMAFGLGPNETTLSVQETEIEREGLPFGPLNHYEIEFTYDGANKYVVFRSKSEFSGILAIVDNISLIKIADAPCPHRVAASVNGFDVEVSCQ